MELFVAFLNNFPNARQRGLSEEKYHGYLTWSFFMICHPLSENKCNVFI
jgi:hypothetical protein